MIIEGPPGPTNINIYIFFHNVIHIYEISVVHLSFLYMYMYLPCDEMFLYNKKLWCEIYFKIFLGP